MAPHALVVPHAAACTNPGCGLLHRMCALVAGAVGDVAAADGEVYRVAVDLLARLDQLEGYRADAEATSAYLRRPVDVAPVDGVSPPCPAQAYLIADEARWRALVDRGAAAAYATYDRTLADGVPKPCCVAAPGHAGPHDVISPFDPA